MLASAHGWAWKPARSALRLQEIAHAGGVPLRASSGRQFPYCLHVASNLGKRLSSGSGLDDRYKSFVCLGKARWRVDQERLLSQPRRYQLSDRSAHPLLGPTTPSFSLTALAISGQMPPAALTSRTTGSHSLALATKRRKTGRCAPPHSFVDGWRLCIFGLPPILPSAFAFAMPARISEESHCCPAIGTMKLAVVLGTGPDTELVATWCFSVAIASQPMIEQRRLPSIHEVYHSQTMIARTFREMYKPIVCTGIVQLYQPTTASHFVPTSSTPDDRRFGSRLQTRHLSVTGRKQLGLVIAHILPITSKTTSTTISTPTTPIPYPP